MWSFFVGATIFGAVATTFAATPPVWTVFVLRRTSSIRTLLFVTAIPTVSDAFSDPVGVLAGPSGRSPWNGRLLEFPSLSSTNTWALNHAGDCRHGDVIWAHIQTAGRGRFDRSWVAPGNTCLTFSVVMDTPPLTWPPHVVGQGAALAVRRTLAAFELDARLKWPNDVLVAGRKISGILLETNTDAPRLVLGIGVNVNVLATDLERPDFTRPATSMLAILGQTVDRRTVLVRLLSELKRVLDDPPTAGLWAEWAAHDWLRDQPVEARTSDGVYRGQYLGLDSQGCVRILGPAGAIVTLASGDVERLAIATP